MFHVEHQSKTLRNKLALALVCVPIDLWHPLSAPLRRARGRKENPMRKFANLAFALPVTFLALVLAVLPASALQPAQQAPPKGDAGTLVIVFKDGHRQTVKLADVQHLEFPGPVPAGLISSPGPSRPHFVGKWEVGEGNGDNFTITLRDDGSALRSLGDEHGTWQYVNGEAQIRWNDGSNDCIRKVGDWYKKFWYSENEAFNGTPENVTNARNLTQNPKGVD